MEQSKVDDLLTSAEALNRLASTPIEKLEEPANVVELQQQINDLMKASDSVKDQLRQVTQAPTKSLLDPTERGEVEKNEVNAAELIMKYDELVNTQQERLNSVLKLEKEMESSKISVGDRLSELAKDAEAKQSALATNPGARIEDLVKTEPKLLALEEELESLELKLANAPDAKLLPVSTLELRPLRAKVDDLRKFLAEEKERAEIAIRLSNLETKISAITPENSDESAILVIQHELAELNIEDPKLDAWRHTQKQKLDSIAEERGKVQAELEKLKRDAELVEKQLEVIRSKLVKPLEIPSKSKEAKRGKKRKGKAPEQVSEPELDRDAKVAELGKSIKELEEEVLPTIARIKSTSVPTAIKVETEVKMDPAKQLAEASALVEKLKVELAQY